MKQILFLIAILSITATNYAQTFTVDGLEYEVTSTNPNEVTITGGTPATTDLVIPQTVSDGTDTFTVTSVGVEAFKDELLTTVAFPTTIRTIEDEAFRNSQLASLNLPEGLTSIGFLSFQGTSITSLNLPESLISIGNLAFVGTPLTSLTLSEGLVNIGDEAFRDNQLTNLVIPSTVTSISARAFEGNDLTSLTLSEGLVIIRNDAFINNQLTNLVIPSTVTSIRGRAFEGNNLTSVNSLATTPPSIITGANDTFGSNRLAIDLTIPSGSEAAYEAATWTGFNSINGSDFIVGSTFIENNFNYTVTSIAPNEVEITGGTNVPQDLTIQGTVSSGGSEFTVTRIGNEAFRDISLTTLILSEGITEIGATAFRGNQITTLSLPEGLTTIGNQAFRGNDLTSLILPASITNIEGLAFGSNPLNAINALGFTPAAITTGDNDTFGTNRNVIDLTIPPGSEAVYEAATWTGFRSVNGIRNFEVGDTFTENNFNYRVISITPNEVEITGGTNAPQNLTIAGTVTSEGNDFTVTRIGNDAFRDISLTTLILSEGLIEIDEDAFRDNQITTLELPETVTIIRDRAFLNNQIASLVLPDEIVTIGGQSFQNNQIPSLNIPDGITAIENQAFQNNLITSLSLPEGLTTIGSQAFIANDLTSLILPANITDIGSRAFEGNPLTAIIALGGTPATITTGANDTFGTNRGAIDLNIPLGSETTYQAAAWNGFRSVNDSDFIVGDTFTENNFNYTVLSVTPNEVEITGGTNVPQNLTLAGTVRSEGSDFTVTRIVDRAFKDISLATLILSEGITEIGNEAFRGNEITSVEFPTSLVTIGSRAFQDNEITSVELPASLVTIGFQAFISNQLTSLTLSEGLTTIGERAFEQNNLTSLTLPDGLTEIGALAFKNNLISGTLNIPNSVTSIGDQSFNGNELNRVFISENITDLGNNTFENNQINSIIIPASVTTIGTRTFGSNPLIQVSPLGMIPPSIINGDDDTFFGSRGDITLIVPQETTQAYEDAGWTGFASIDEANRGDIIIGYLAFDITSTNPNEVQLRDGIFPLNPNIEIPSTVSDGSEEFTVTSIADIAIKASGITSVEIPNTVVATGFDAFSNNDITSVVLPEGITTISKQSFQNNELASINLPNSVTVIDDNAFKSNQLTAVTLPINVNTIGLEAFGENPIRSITSLNPTPPSIEANSFSNRGQINLSVPIGTKQVYLNAGWTDFGSLNEVDIISDFLFYTITGTNPNEVQLIGGTPTGNLEIPATVSKGLEIFTVTSIQGNALGIGDLTSVVLPNTVVSIGTLAFNSNALTSVVLPESITTISKQSFQFNKLSSIDLPESVMVVDNNAFRNNELTAVTLPINVSDIGIQAFQNNPITEVTSLNTEPPSIADSSFSNRNQITLQVPQGTRQDYIDEGWTDFAAIEEIDTGAITSGTLFYEITATSPNEVALVGGAPPLDLTIPSTVSNGSEDFTVTSIADTALAQGNLTSVVLPNTVAQTGVAAFSSNALTSVVLPEGITTISRQSFQFNDLGSIDLPTSVTVIDNNAFRNNQLTAVTLPANVSAIGIQTFQNNPITEVTSLNIIPPSIENSSFSNRNQIIVNVPQGTRQDYIDAGWTDFAAIIEFAFDITDGFLFYKIRANAPTEVEVIGGRPPLDLTIPSTVSNGSEDFTVTFIADNILPERNLTRIVWPNTIAQTGVSAFSRNALTSVVLPEGITTISKQSLQFNQLSSIDLPNSVTVIDNNAFRNNQLTEVILPANVSAIGIQAFQNNPITEVTSLNTEPPSIEGSSFSNRNQITLNIPQGTIAAYEAAGWTDFASIEEFDRGDFTDGVLFYDITSTGPNEVQVVGGVPPSDLIIPSTTSNGVEDFTVTSIATNALSGLNLTSVVLPNTITATGFGAFSNNALTSVVIPEGISTISKQSFRNNELGSIDFPNSVTIIDNNAFTNNRLTQVILPANVSAIGIQTFENNPINEVTSFNTEPPSIAGSSFSNRNQIILNVPEGTTAAYEAAGWTDFASIEEFEIDIRVAPKVFLQGASLNPIAGEEGLMRDSLRENGLLPTNSPYGDGASVSPTVFDSTGANAIVDWVLVELRSGPDNENTTVIASKAALLQRDGDIVGLDGTSEITFTVDDGDYFIAIRHRNHIGILAAVSAPLSGAATAVDFTQDITTAKGENLALTTLVNGTFAMIAGDADGSSQILNTDITEGLTLAGGGEDYSNADADMNGFVLNSDIQLLILGNSGTVQQFE